jgi:hypothetical protein
VKSGDLVVFDNCNGTGDTNRLWLILKITKTKKTWHRKIALYNSLGTIELNWLDKHMLVVINEKK